MTESRPTVFDDILDLALARDEARRSMLARVLVDGFVRDPGPRTARECKQFEELMVNLLGSVDAFTRAVVAQKLAPRADVPQRLLHMLLADEDEIAEPLLASSPLVKRQHHAAPLAEGGTSVRNALARRSDVTSEDRRQPDLSVASVGTPTATPSMAVANRPVVPTFLDASSSVRRALIEHLGVADAGGRHSMASPELMKALLRHAVLRQRNALASTLGTALGIGAGIAQRIIDDNDGEPLVVAARALSLPEEAFTQLLLLANPAIGERYDKVASLRALYRETRVEAARAIIVSLAENAPPPTRHQPVLTERRKQTTESMDKSASRFTGDKIEAGPATGVQ